MPCECAGSTAAFEAAGRGPIPRWGARCPRASKGGQTPCIVRRIESGIEMCRGSDPVLRQSRPRSVMDARDSAKVEDQVRFLAGALVDVLTLEPDGRAAACKAVSSGFDSRRRL